MYKTHKIINFAHDLLNCRRTKKQMKTNHIYKLGFFTFSIKEFHFFCSILTGYLPAVSWTLYIVLRLKFFFLNASYSSFNSLFQYRKSSKDNLSSACDSWNRRWGHRFLTWFTNTRTMSTSCRTIVGGRSWTQWCWAVWTVSWSTETVY